jgi:putative transcriptional regulator
MSSEKHKSNNLEAVYDTEQNQPIDKETVRKCDIAGVEPVPAYSAEQIRYLRERYRLSKPVMAAVLNTSLNTIQKWEVGDRRPSGTSSKLLSILDRRGLEVLLNN